MSSSRRGGGGPKLPHEVVVEILKRLPARSLLRFRCVCRSWRSTIDDPRFVALHSRYSPLVASNWYLVDLERGDYEERRCFLYPHESLALHSRSEIEIPFVDPDRGHRLVGSCNGLICFKEVSEDGRETMCLWNLFTRKHKRLSNPGFFSTLSIHHHAPGTHEALGFGFDPRSDDYKILRILYLPGNTSRVQICSVSTDSWRSLNCEAPDFCAYSPSVFLNGNLHWLVSKRDDTPDSRCCYASVLFDCTREVFDEMAITEFVHVGVAELVELSVLNGLLAFCIGPTEWQQPPSVCSVWVMREYGVPESWTKLYSFEVGRQVTGFDGFTRNGELLMVIDYEQQGSWNPITGQFAILPLSMHCELVVSIVESLVSP